MSGLETAIRTALASADRNNPEVRARIYQSARQALEAGLRKQDITDADAITRHRHRLEETIHAIEAEERGGPTPRASQAELPVAPDVDAPAPSSPRLPRDSDGVILEGETRHVSANRSAEARLDDVHAVAADHLGPSLDAEDRISAAHRAEAMNFRPERAAVRRRPRKIFSRLLLWCIVLAFIGIGAWWAHTSGVLLTPAQRDTSVSNPPASTAPEDYDGDDGDTKGVAAPGIDPQNGFSSEWTELFRPADMAKLQKGAQADAEAVKDTDGDAVRLTSRNGGDDGNVGIRVPAAVLQQMAGKSSTIALTLQSTSDQPTQITVTCDFRSLGDCTRHRFTVNRDKQDALLQVRFDRSLAPDADGTIFINSDVDGTSRGINLYAVRVLVGQ